MIPPVVNPVIVGAFENVLEPVRVCVPVETRPRAVQEASGRLNVWVFPDETILKSVPLVPMAKICITHVSPLIDPILLLNIFQSVDDNAPVIVVEASSRESPVPLIERPFVAPEMNPILLLNAL